MKFNFCSTYRSFQYCEIPDTKYGCLNISCCSSVYYVKKYYTKSKPIHPTSNEILSCGCFAFESDSHLLTCKFYNKYETQPYYCTCLL